MAETLNALKSFTCISAPVIIKTLEGQLISNLKFNEMASSLPEELKTSFEILSTEKVFQAINLIREIPLDETMQQDYNKIDETYKGLQPPQISVEGALDSLAPSPVISLQDLNLLPIPTPTPSASTDSSSLQVVEYEATITDSLANSVVTDDLLNNLPIKSWDQIKALEKIVTE